MKRYKTSFFTILVFTNDPAFSKNSIKKTELGEINLMKQSMLFSLSSYSIYRGNQDDETVVKQN